MREYFFLALDHLVVLNKFCPELVIFGCIVLYLLCNLLTKNCCFVCSESSTVNAPVNWSKGRMLGSGGFGQVYICHDRDLGRDLAVKVVSVRCQLDDTSEVCCSRF